MPEKKVMWLVGGIDVLLMLFGGAVLFTALLVWLGYVFSQQQSAALEALQEQEEQEQAALRQQERERAELEEKARAEKPYLDCRQRIQQLTAVVDEYKRTNGEYPQTLQALMQPQPKGGLPFFAEPGKLLDPWGAPFKYDPSGPNNAGKRPDIWSDSPRGKIGNWPKQPAAEHGP
jgi:hypothetical protein